MFNPQKGVQRQIKRLHLPTLPCTDLALLTLIKAKSTHGHTYLYRTK